MQNEEAMLVLFMNERQCPPMISPANPHTILAAHGNDGTTIVLKDRL